MNEWSGTRTCCMYRDGPTVGFSITTLKNGSASYTTPSSNQVSEVQHSVLTTLECFSTVSYIPNNFFEHGEIDPFLATDSVFQHFCRVEREERDRYNAGHAFANHRHLHVQNMCMHASSIQITHPPVRPIHATWSVEPSPRTPFYSGRSVWCSCHLALLGQTCCSYSELQRTQLVSSASHNYSTVWHCPRFVVKNGSSNWLLMWLCSTIDPPQ